MQLNKATLDFLAKLSKNNDRDWFNANKAEYQTAHANFVDFADAILTEMQKHDNIETPNGKKSLHRIYRDVRFSKDKTPYNIHLSGSFSRATKELRGGYYFHVSPGNSFLGGGFWGPNSEDLKLIRDHIAADPDPLRDIIQSKAFKSHFGELGGEQLKTAPKGFPKDHEAIELLRYKQFLISKKFTDKEVLSPDFYKEVNKGFKAMRPFFDYMSECLTTDLNGVSLI